MLNAVKKYGRQRSVSKLLSKPRQKHLKKYSDMKRMLWIFNLTDEAAWMLLIRCVQEFENNGKEICLIGFAAKDIQKNFIIDHPRCLIFREKENFSFWGIPHHQEFSRFMAQPFDAVLDVTGCPNFFAHYISLVANADLRISYDDTSVVAPIEWRFKNTDVYDLVISNDAPFELRYFLQKLVEYLKIITQ